VHSSSSSRFRGVERKFGHHSVAHDRRVIVYPEKAALANAVATQFIDSLTESLSERGVAHVVLTGGSMGSAVLEAVATLGLAESVQWSGVHFWWGDERWLPAGDPERNETQARVALLDSPALAASTVHAFPSSDSGLTLDSAAESYANDLKSAAESGALLPRFDITFLGVGPDGHIASLFPDKPGILEREKTVIAVQNSPKPPPERLSLTRPALNTSQAVWLVLSGADKASALGLALAGASMSEVPASGIKGRSETVFYVDAAASAEVPENLTTTEIFWTAADS
jgi:6-phosphogluconolactonase